MVPVRRRGLCCQFICFPTRLKENVNLAASPEREKVYPLTNALS